MKSILSTAFFTVALLISSVAGHSWLECSDDNAINHDEIKANPNVPL